MITFQDVKKSYGSYIFDVSSLHIPQGIITGLVGKNGAGKTTAIKMMLGLGKARRWGSKSIRDRCKASVSTEETGDRSSTF